MPEQARGRDQLTCLKEAEDYDKLMSMMLQNLQILQALTMEPFSPIITPLP